MAAPRKPKAEKPETTVAKGTAQATPSPLGGNVASEPREPEVTEVNGTTVRSY